MGITSHEIVSNCLVSITNITREKLFSPAGIGPNQISYLFQKVHSRYHKPLPVCLYICMLRLITEDETVWSFRLYKWSNGKITKVVINRIVVLNCSLRLAFILNNFKERANLWNIDRVSKS